MGKWKGKGKWEGEGEGTLEGEAALAWGERDCGRGGGGVEVGGFCHLEL